MTMVNVRVDPSNEDGLDYNDDDDKDDDDDKEDTSTVCRKN